MEVPCPKLTVYIRTLASYPLLRDTLKPVRVTPVISHCQRGYPHRQFITRPFFSARPFYFTRRDTILTNYAHQEHWLAPRCSKTDPSTASSCNNSYMRSWC